MPAMQVSWHADARQESTLKLLDKIWRMIANQRQQRHAEAHKHCSVEVMNGIIE